MEYLLIISSFNQSILPSITWQLHYRNHNQVYKHNLTVHCNHHCTVNGIILQFPAVKKYYFQYKVFVGLVWLTSNHIFGSGDFWDKRTISKCQQCTPAIYHMWLLVLILINLSKFVIYIKTNYWVKRIVNYNSTESNLSNDYFIYFLCWDKDYNNHWWIIQYSTFHKNLWK